MCVGRRTRTLDFRTQQEALDIANDLRVEIRRDGWVIVVGADNEINISTSGRLRGPITLFEDMTRAVDEARMILQLMVLRAQNDRDDANPQFIWRQFILDAIKHGDHPLRAMRPPSNPAFERAMEHATKTVRHIPYAEYQHFDVQTYKPKGDA